MSINKIIGGIVAFLMLISCEEKVMDLKMDSVNEIEVRKENKEPYIITDKKRIMKVGNLLEFARKEMFVEYMPNKMVLRYENQDSLIVFFNENRIRITGRTYVLKRPLENILPKK